MQFSKQTENDYPSKELLNEIFVNQNICGERLDLLHQVCISHIEEAYLLSNLLNKYRFEPVNWSIEYRYLKQDGFNAYASHLGEYDKSYAVNFSLGIPSLLLSVAIELDSKDPIKEYKNNKRTSINDWFPHIVSKEDVSHHTINWVLDACLLVYYHEICHVMFGHCDYNHSGAEEARVLEMDADFNAGSMFGSYLKYFFEEGRHYKSGEDTLKRVLRAGFLLRLAFEALSKDNNEYHLPTNRAMSFCSGCMYLLSHEGKINNIHDVIDNDLYYETLLTKEMESLIKSLEKSSIKEFKGVKDDVNNDYEELMDITAPLRDSLKDGSLNDLKIPNLN